MIGEYRAARHGCWMLGCAGCAATGRDATRWLRAAAAEFRAAAADVSCPTRIALHDLAARALQLAAMPGDDVLRRAAALDELVLAAGAFAEGEPLFTEAA